MRKISAIIIGSMIGATLLFSQDTISIEDYFPHIQGMQWFYEFLKPTKNGQLRQSFRECIKTDTIDGELSTIIRTITYLGTMKLEVINIYAIVDNAILLTLTKGMTGSKEYLNRPILAKLPKDNKKTTWELKTEDGTVYKSEAKIIHSLKTKLGKFKDVIKVIEKAYVHGALRITKYMFYAKNYGLVKVEAYNAAGDPLNMLSYQLVKLKK